MADVAGVGERGEVARSGVQVEIGLEKKKVGL